MGKLGHIGRVHNAPNNYRPIGDDKDIANTTAYISWGADVARQAKSTAEAAHVFPHTSYYPDNTDGKCVNTTY